MLIGQDVVSKVRPQSSSAQDHDLFEILTNPRAGRRRVRSPSRRFGSTVSHWRIGQRVVDRIRRPAGVAGGQLRPRVHRTGTKVEIAVAVVTPSEETLLVVDCICVNPLALSSVSMAKIVGPV